MHVDVHGMCEYPLAMLLTDTISHSHFLSVRSPLRFQVKDFVTREYFVERAHSTVEDVAEAESRTMEKVGNRLYTMLKGMVLSA